MNKQITKNQHYIPESLLVNFTNADKKLFEVLLDTKKIYPASPSNSMCETYTYEHENLKVNTIENFFSKIEGEVAPLTIKLIESIESIRAGKASMTIVKKAVEGLLGRYLLFYYRSGALLTEYSSLNKEDKIPLLSEKILNSEYIAKLAEAISTFYNFAIIESEDDFLLSDQFISTAALRIKTQFFELSNRHIGLNETMLLIPVSARYYIVFWNSKQEFICKANTLKVLDENQTRLINETIINNAYTKCVGQKKERIEEVLDSFQRISPTQVFAGGGPDGHFMGSIKKKEVFFYADEREAWMLFESMAVITYKDLGRNDKCKCGSGKKFKHCHLDAYNRMQSIMQTFGLPREESMRRFLISGIQIIEQPIDQWSGFEKK